MTEIINNTENIKLYSSKSITGATFFGGPLAGGYLISENLNSLNKPEQARKSLLFGIIFSLILFGGIFMIPEKIVDKIPNQFIPLIYTGIIWGIVEWLMGGILKAHKENENEFFSGYKAAGIGLLSLLINGAIIFGFIYIETDSLSMIEYQEKMDEFDRNEMETKKFYNELSFQTEDYLINELDSKILPNWRKNIEIVKESNNIEGLPETMINRNKYLLEYSNLRLEEFNTFRMALKIKNFDADSKLEEINRKMEKVMKNLEEASR